MPVSLTGCWARVIKLHQHPRQGGIAYPMTDLRREFDQAAEDIQHLAVRPDNDTLLKLYALYKQGSDGDLCAAQPGFFDFVGTAKHEAWGQLKGTSAEDAQMRYIALVQQLLT